MKTILKFSLIVLVAMTTMSSYANDGDFLLNVKKGTGKQIGFSVNEIKKAKVTIYDKDHVEIYSEIVTGNHGISRIYSLEEFPDGDYTLEVETDLKRVTHEIAITNDSPSLSRRAIAEVYKGELKMKNHNVATTN
jgi:hypothetical protein